MGILDQVEVFLEQMEKNIYDFGEKYARGRIDVLLSTLKLLGIRESLPKEQADYVMEDLEDVEDIDE